MSDKIKFKADKLSIIDFKLIKGQVDTPEDFCIDNVVGNEIQNTLELGFNFEDKLVKTDYKIDVTSDSKGKNKKEAIISFHLVYIFKVENLEELAILNKDNLIDLDSMLANSLASITYSTSRGVLLTRLQGTSFQNFILPIINPDKLLYK